MTLLKKCSGIGYVISIGLVLFGAVNGVAGVPIVIIGLCFGCTTAFGIYAGQISEQNHGQNHG